MTTDEAIEYCYSHQDEYIRDFNSLTEGMRAFECLIECVKSGHITEKELAQHGMDY